MSVQKENLSQYCERIITGKTLFRFPNPSVIVEVHDPDLSCKQEAEFYASEYFQDVTFDEIPSLESLKILAVQKQIWRTDFDQFIADYPKKRKELVQEIKKLEYRSVEKLKPQAALKRLESQLAKIQSVDSLLEQHSLEYLINVFKHKYYLYKQTKIDGVQFFTGSFSEFLKNTDNTILDRMISQCFYPKHLTESIIRLVARNEPWRSIWLASVKTGNLFPHSGAELTDLQRALISWSVVYDNSFEASDPPSDETIEDDILFDAWLEDRRNESERKRAVNKMSLGSSSSDKSQVGVIVNTPEDAQRVWKLNTPQTLAVLENNQRAIAEKGIIKEAHLPDSQRIMRNKLAEQQRK